MRSKLIFLIIGCLMMAAALNLNICRADAVDDAESVISGIVMFKMRESGCENEAEWVAKAIPSGAGIDTDAYAYGLAKLGGYDLRPYSDALVKFLNENEVRSATTRLKYALCLIPYDPDDPYIAGAVDSSVGQLGIMSLAYGLHLYNNGFEAADYPPEKIIEDILAMEHEDGGWSVMGEYGDADVTAMVLQSLAGYIYCGEKEDYGEENTLSSDNTAVDDTLLASVREVVEKGLSFLSGKQLESGGYAGFGAENAESTAQVLIALSDIGIDALTDERFIKNGATVFDGLAEYRLDDGSYSHVKGGESNSTATSQVFTAMVAYKCMKDGRAPYYVYDGENVGKAEEGTADGEHSGSDRRDGETAHTPDMSGATGKDAADNDTSNSNTSSFRLIACSILGALTLIVCVVLIALRKTNYKNFIFIVILNIIAVFAIFRINIQSPEEYYSAGGSATGQSIGQVTMTIRCDTIVGLSDSEFVPESGVIMDKTGMELHEGETVYDLLVRAVRENGIHMENMKTGLGAHGAYYISGINHIYEYEYGELSGWMYYVNGEAPSVGCGEYVLKDGDEIAWLYTREIGRDIEQ